LAGVALIANPMPGAMRLSRRTIKDSPIDRLAGAFRSIWDA
jgi:hypothetical protein